MTKQSNRVIYIYEKKTSMCLDDAEWDALDSMCATENTNRNELLSLVSTFKDADVGLTTATRILTQSYHYHASMIQLKKNSLKNNSITSPLFAAIQDIL